MYLKEMIHFISVVKFMDVLVCSGRYTKISHIGQLINNRNLFLTSISCSDRGSLRSWGQYGWARAFFQVTGYWLLAMPPHGRRGQRSLWNFFFKALRPFIRVPSSLLKYLDKATLTHTITLGVRVLTYFQQKWICKFTKRHVRECL